MSHPSSAIPCLESFDCEGEPTSVSGRWGKWKRALENYFIASNIDTSITKRATLLHLGVLSLQEIYYNLPGAEVESSEGVDFYKTALEKLDEYFAPKQCYIYERYIFGLMKQEEDERFDKFLVKLRQQAEKCKFADKEERIIDPITGKCRSEDLRKKILEIGDSITLHRRHGSSQNSIK